jgi:hypothetical protein
MTGSAKQSRAAKKDRIDSAFALRASADAVVARAPRNDVERFSPTSQRHRERKRSNPVQHLNKKAWIASSQGLLAMTWKVYRRPLSVIASASEAIKER